MNKLEGARFFVPVFQGSRMIGEELRWRRRRGHLGTRKFMIDRYLLTNQGAALAFSKGSDLFAKDRLAPRDVCLRSPDSLIARLLSPTGNKGILKR
jgi:hypothetical protein